MSTKSNLGGLLIHLFPRASDQDQIHPMATSLEILLNPWPTQSALHKQQQQQQQPSPSSSLSSQHSSSLKQHLLLYYHYQNQLHLQLSPTDRYRPPPGTTAHDLERRSIALGEFLFRRRWRHPDVAGFEDLIIPSSASCSGRSPSPDDHENDDDDEDEDEDEDDNDDDYHMNHDGSDDDDDDDDDDNDNDPPSSSFYYKTLTASVNLDETNSLASVWLLSRTASSSSSSSSITGAGNQHHHHHEEIVTVLHWWRRKGVWECFRQSGMGVVGGEGGAGS
ncbi:uncharacterized protein K489DRAFT_434413 [Dissoconium aciculare CBS 342.82]|uniref:Uncharacterized protein n=1 Tax=Dissoconium aciculare CBS 342.82 TaxID=1314786 RepID=A0A6J3LWQ1_9PEZI|nr:uncharacterized protein K489DRAFT_434413 [Dissoconium aciculare CBS 342.82]KAF1819067.1 hypothetical protein K489DRAFT_434413 [Dissoconium aciculare CBS 342.82]